MMVIGITGGMGSGKSYVSHLLTERYGIPVYDCDKEAKRLNEESFAIRQALCQLVGEKVYDQEGHLQKNILANYLFENEAHQQQINSIIHPVVRQDFEEWCAKQNGCIVGIESAILIESGFSSLAQEIICVTAPLELRIQRAMLRDGHTEEQVKSRVRLQMSDKERKSYCQHTIINDGRSLINQIEEILQEIEINSKESGSPLDD